MQRVYAAWIIHFHKSDHVAVTVSVLNKMCVPRSEVGLFDKTLGTIG